MKEPNVIIFRFSGSLSAISKEFPWLALLSPLLLLHMEDRVIGFLAAGKSFHPVPSLTRLADPPPIPLTRRLRIRGILIQNDPIQNFRSLEQPLTSSPSSLTQPAICRSRHHDWSSIQNYGCDSVLPSAPLLLQ